MACIGNHSNAGNNFQRVCTVPEINATIGSWGRVDKIPLWADESPTCLVRNVNSINVQLLGGVESTSLRIFILLPGSFLNSDCLEGGVVINPRHEGKSLATGCPLFFL